MVSIKNARKKEKKRAESELFIIVGKKKCFYKMKRKKEIERFIFKLIVNIGFYFFANVHTKKI